ncbi:MAG: glucose-1-phosphate adenylyltransferase [Desulfobacterales bacterium C00003060]|nr:MAG: glucose-1-phosphate adenylyltransferase [Desulfobacterales bacterium S3730MH5]OEU77300.1 MAG: glucose-1-phosphate adenylyltransferase [Desulfobacterales bacterium C00003060]OEU80076.1 MAG: glucose-1-phosphate adenylyltransferase [Desulfobacterales bacterium S5133MH4]
MARDVIALVMAGGKGERLHPLTEDRSKPAVPFGGIYRIIDITLSNCINSNIYKIVILPQYKAQSLVEHLEAGWNIFSYDLGHYLRVVPPQMRVGEDWYRGTADSVRQNLYLIERDASKHLLILSGDHVYKMDYSRLKAYHEEKGADITISVIEVPTCEAYRFGVVEVTGDYSITGFKEKPVSAEPMPGDPRYVLASMGVYIFKAQVLIDLLKSSDKDDFGKDIIPMALERYSLYAFPYKKENRIEDFVYTIEEDGTRVRVLDPCIPDSSYWRDVGDLDAYWNANMDLTGVNPNFNLYGTKWPLRTFQRQYPPVKTIFRDTPSSRTGMALDSLVSHGSIVSGVVKNSVLSYNVIARSWSEVGESVIMSDVEVGRHCRIMKAIIDKGNRIPPRTEIGYNPEEDRKRYTVTPRGIVVVPKRTFT